jgi:putative oxidoreductase
MRRLLPLNPDLALLLLRVVLGIVMLAHGMPKLLHFGGVAEGFAGMGVPAPTLAAAFAAIAEAVGGVLMLLGVAVDLAGLLFAIDMLGAITFVHAAKGFSAGNGGYEFPLVLLAAALAIALAGPGRYSVGRKGVKT